MQGNGRHTDQAFLDARPADKRSLLYRYRAPVLSCLLAALILVVFGQVTGFDFIILDDGVYVYENRYVRNGFTAESLTWAFSFAGKDDTYWHPLTWLSHILDCHLFGLRPGWHHLTNLLLHVANSLLLFQLFRRLTGSLGRSLLVAVLFALHPLNVESVAWVAERKNVLSTFFWMLTLLAYVRYCQAPGRRGYLIILLVFSLGLLSKPMLITLPGVLFLLDYWPLRRFMPYRTAGDADPAGILPDNARQLSVLRLVGEKVPLLVLSGLSIFVSLLSLQKLGSIVPAGAVPLDLRLANALVSCVAYIGKLVWPAELAVIYPYPETMLPTGQIVGAFLFLASVSLAVCATNRSRPYLVVGWLWYLGTQLPVSGLVQGGLWPAMADRWAYVPFIGLFIMIGWGLPDLFAPRGKKGRWAAGLSMAACLILGLAAWKQVGYWRNSITLLERTLQVTGPNPAAHELLGVAFDRQGRTKAAIEHYRQALRIRPGFVDALNNMGIALHRQGKTEDAIALYLKAISLRPEFEKAHFNLGIALEAQGKTAVAVNYYRNAVKLKPGFVTAHYNLAVALEKRGAIDEAILHYRAVIQQDPGFIRAYTSLGTALGKQGHTGQAIAYYRQALSLAPDNALAHFNLGIALTRHGDSAGAIEHYRRALVLKPDFAEGHNNIAILFFNRGDLTRAREHLRKAVALDPDNTMARQNLDMILKQFKQGRGS